MDLEPLKIDRSREAFAASQGGGSRSLWPRVLLLGAILFLAWVVHEPLLRLIDRVRLPEVEVVLVRRSSARTSAAASGTAANGYVVAEKRAALSADTPGRIVEMLVTEGSQVKAGQVVARLYADEFKASLAQREAELIASENTVNRTKAELEVAQANLSWVREQKETQVATLKEAEAFLRLAEQRVERFEKLSTDNIESLDRLDTAVAERDQAKARRSRAQAELQVAGADIERTQLQVSVAEGSLSEALALVSVRRSARDLAQATLEKTEVRAPFDGIVVLKDAEVGEVVSPNSQGGQSRGSVCTIVDPRTLEVQVDLPETSLSVVRLGASVRIFLDAFPERPYAGKVKRIWPTANRQKATVEVRVGFEALADGDRHGGIRPDLGARVVFLSEDGETEARKPEEFVHRILIPSECVVRIEGQSGVFLLERDVALWHELQVEETSSKSLLVKSGLEGGERILKAPPLDLASGDRVRPLSAQ